MTRYECEMHGDLGRLVDAAEVTDMEAILLAEAGTVTLGESTLVTELDLGTGSFDIIKVVFDVVVARVELMQEGRAGPSHLTRGGGEVVVVVVRVDLFFFFVLLVLDEVGDTCPLVRWVELVVATIDGHARQHGCKVTEEGKHLITSRGRSRCVIRAIHDEAGTAGLRDTLATWRKKMKYGDFV